MQDKEFLKELLETVSPSGYEEEAQQVFSEYIKKLNDINPEYYQDGMKNCGFSIGEEINPTTGEKNPVIMISGHIDEIGLQVSGFNDKGLLYVSRLGGIDLKCLPGQIVMIKSSNQESTVSGVIGKKPIHLEERDERDNTEKLSEILVDIGAKSKEEAKEMVSIGDPMIIASQTNLYFGKDQNLILSRGLDDKIGVYITAMVLRELSFNKPDFLERCLIWGVSCTQEEVGLRGAMRAAKNINPDYSIDIDVTFANDEGRSIKDDELRGDIILGEGPVIMHGPDKDKNLNNILKKAAKFRHLGYQETIAGVGGTNTAIIQEFSGNTITTHLGIPLRNMHTPVEICSDSDIESAIKMLYSALEILIDKY